MATAEEKYISLRRLNDFKTLLESEYKIDKHTNQIQSLVNRGTKNLLRITASSRTLNGLTFTVNNDRTVTVNGTATATAVFNLYIISAATVTEYMGQVLSGCPTGGSESTYRLVLQLNSGNYTTFASDTGNGAVIENFTAAECRASIIVNSGTSVSNITFKPMICTAEDYAISQEFAPYSPSNRELYERMLISSFANVASTFSSLCDYVDTLDNGVHSFYVPINNTLSDVPMNDSGAIVTATVYNNNTSEIKFTPVNATYQQYRYLKIKSSGTWGSWIKFDGFPGDTKVTDINTAVTAGVYRFYGNGQTSNLPSDITATSPFGILEVTTSGVYIKQVLTHFVSSAPPAVYIRRSSNSGSAWTSWAKLTFTTVT